MTKVCSPWYYHEGAKNSPGNYRPVSLTSVICKVLESFVTDAIQNYMESNNLFNQCQHGFRTHRSCVTQLLEVMNELTKIADNKEDMDIIYLDFSKAFDTVPHKRLINKLKAYGIEGNLLNWIAHFLKDRRQRVRVNNSYSDFSPVASGIPQGSILGPDLFIIYINDLPENIKSCCKIFADDTKLYGPSKSHDILQEDLLNLLKWSDIWQLKFNVSKCHVLHIGTNDKAPTYYMNSDNTLELSGTDSEKDIGVTFSNNLKFDKHINNIISKANQMTGIIKRSFKFMDKDMFIKLYKSIVRPHLEYANVIWHPLYKRQLASLEKVQRRATKILPELKDMSYSERLIALNLPSVQYRQLRNDLLQTYKILHKIDNLNSSDFFTVRADSKTRNSDLKLYKYSTKTQVRSNFLSFRVNNIWNSLTAHSRLAPSILTFKINIDKELDHMKFLYNDS